MVKLSHRTFLDLSIHVLGIGFVRGPEINLNGNMSGGCHGVLLL
jgi:hypothetical protein